MTSPSHPTSARTHVRSAVDANCVAPGSDFTFCGDGPESPLRRILLPNCAFTPSPHAHTSPFAISACDAPNVVVIEITFDSPGTIPHTNRSSSSHHPETPHRWTPSTTPSPSASNASACVPAALISTTGDENFNDVCNNSA